MSVEVAAGAVVALGSRGGLAAVLDADRRCFGGAECVDAEQVGQGAVVHAECLGDLEEAEQLEPVQALGAGLVLMDFRQPSHAERTAG